MKIAKYKIRELVRRIIKESINKSDVDSALEAAVLKKGEARNKTLLSIIEDMETEKDKENMMDIISRIVTGKFNWDEDFYQRGYSDEDLIPHEKHFIDRRSFSKTETKDLDPILGDYVWPDDHNDIMSLVERNTDIENLIRQEVINLLAARKEGVYYAVSEEVFSALNSIAVQGTYPDIFSLVSPNEKKFVYRGLVMERERFEELFGKIEDDVGTFIQQIGRNIKNTFYSVLNYLGERVGLNRKKGREAMVAQVKPGENSIYSDLSYAKEKSDTILGAENTTNAHSFWTPSMRSAFSYAAFAREKAGFKDPVMFILTASTNVSNFLDLDLIINQYGFAKELSRGTPRSEYMLLGDAIINNIYVLYDKRIKAKKSKEDQMYLTAEDFED
jgi:hypothetical protein